MNKENNLKVNDIYEVGEYRFIYRKSISLREYNAWALAFTVLGLEKGRLYSIRHDKTADIPKIYGTERIYKDGTEWYLPGVLQIRKRVAPTGAKEAIKMLKTGLKLRKHSDDLFFPIYKEEIIKETPERFREKIKNGGEFKTYIEIYKEKNKERPEEAHIFEIIEIEGRKL